MREKFKQALLHIITGPFTATNYLLWSAYKEHLRNIDPQELPAKVQPLFLELKDIYESRFEARLNHTKKQWAAATLKTNETGHSWWQGANRMGWNWYNTERKPTEAEIYGHVLQCDLMHNTQHPTAKRIKELIFEIIEKMPKRVRKPKKPSWIKADEQLKQMLDAGWLGAKKIEVKEEELPVVIHWQNHPQVIEEKPDGEPIVEVGRVTLKF